jgi:hypothetical protein
LFAAELEGTGKGLAFFEIYDDTAEPQGHKRM